MSPVSEQELEKMLLCPRQYGWSRALGLSRDAAFPYGIFALLLAQGVRKLRHTWNTAQWPDTWPNARNRLANVWDAEWTLERTLEPMYRDRAFAAYSRVYSELADRGIPTTTRFDEHCTVILGGRELSVRVSAIEDINGETVLIWERAGKSREDEKAVRVALYAAAAQVLAPSRPCPIYIRYLTTGEMLQVPKASTVLEKQHDRICTALSQLAESSFPPTPDKSDRCIYCQFVVICPGRLE